MDDTKLNEQKGADAYKNEGDDPYSCTPEHDAHIHKEVGKALSDKAAKGTDGYVEWRGVLKKLAPDAC